MNLVFSNDKLGAIRIIGDKITPLFCLRDICNVLEHTNPSKALEAINAEFGDGLTLSYPIKDSLGRTQNATFITEPQLYFILIRSDKPQAKPFRQWIVNEVLPSIRKTGSYQKNELDSKRNINKIETKKKQLALNRAKKLLKDIKSLEKQLENKNNKLNDIYKTYENIKITNTKSPIKAVNNSYEKANIENVKKYLETRLENASLDSINNLYEVLIDFDNIPFSPRSKGILLINIKNILDNNMISYPNLKHKTIRDIYTQKVLFIKLQYSNLSIKPTKEENYKQDSNHHISFNEYLNSPKANTAIVLKTHQQFYKNIKFLLNYIKQKSISILNKE